MSELRIYNNSKDIENRLSRMESERMIKMLNPQEKVEIDPFLSMHRLNSQIYTNSWDLIRTLNPHRMSALVFLLYPALFSSSI